MKSIYGNNFDKDCTRYIPTVGEIFYNENGENYTIVYINEELDRTLLVNEFGSYIIACGINYKTRSWAQGHYFIKDFEGAVNYVLGKRGTV